MTEQFNVSFSDETRARLKVISEQTDREIWDLILCAVDEEAARYFKYHRDDPGATGLVGRPHADTGATAAGPLTAAPAAPEDVGSVPTSPSLSLLVKLGSVLVHAQEYLDGGGHDFDLAALVTLFADEDLAAWRAAMDNLGLLPVRR